jgi:PhnB protein
MAVNPIPDGYHTVTPYLIVPDVLGQIDFLKNAFAAEERSIARDGAGRVMHAEVSIGDSVIMMGESNEELPPMPAMLHLYVEDVDAVYAQAVAAGATSLREPTNEFYGDRSGGVQDAAGNQWWVATHVEDVSEEEMMRRMQAQGM